MNQSPAHAEPLTVMVVDDMSGSRRQLAKLVQSLGHIALESGSGSEALAQIERHTPDVALLDLLMPTMNGFELAAAIRKQVVGRWLPVIIVSSLEGDEFLEQALSMGAADYVVRPVKTGILRAKLRQYQRVLSMQSRLAMMAQRHKAIHDNLTDAIITTDSSGRIKEVNQAARVLFGLQETHLRRRVFIQELTGHALQPLLAMSSVDLAVASGAVHPYGVSCTSWRIGVQEFFTIALHDLSVARHVERMKDEFLATVSHELRTPLTSIIGALGLLAAGAGGTLPPAAMELVTVAKRNGDRLSQLIDDMLDLTKLEANRMAITLRPTDLHAVLREAVQANASYAQRSAIRLVLEEAPQACRVQVDPQRLIQVMANLLSNAIKHSPKGGTVWVRVQSLVQQVQVDVVDQGPGIDADFRARLFEKFSQADGSDRRAVGGTGLGLYISRMLMERMGGSIGAESPATGGSLFRLTLPRLLQHNERPWLLCLAKDHELQQRLSDWLGALGQVESVDSLRAAADTMSRLGPPAAVIAAPQAQGPSDAFCSQLANLVRASQVALIGDALCADLASRYGMTWLEHNAPQQVWVQRVGAMLATTWEK